VLVLNLEHPFVYDGGGAPLLLEIENRSGTNTPQGRVSLPVRATRREGGPPRFRTLVQRGASWPVPTAVRPQMVIITETYEPVITRWYETSNGKNARFRRVSSGLVAKGEEPRDFHFLFQGGRRADGDAFEPVTPWSATPPRNASAVRLKIEFEPRIHGALEDAPWIESVTLHTQQH
jgi:hypothetical protein